MSLGRGIPASSRGTSRLGNWYKDAQNETNNAIRVAKQKYFKSIIWKWTKGTRAKPEDEAPANHKCPRYREKPWKRGLRHYLRQNANISALHMHFLFTSFMFFQDSELQFYLWMSNECYFTKSVQEVGGSEGRIGAPLIFRPAVQISLPLCIC